MRSASQAAKWAEAQDTFSPVNNCLRAVLVAYDVLGQIPERARADATATEAWDLAQHKHAGDDNPPRGALVCFPNWGAGKSGHITISEGGGMVRSTGINSSDYFTGTIAQVAERCGNPYAGWIGDFAGRTIDFTAAAGGNSRPIPTPKKAIMSDTQYRTYVPTAADKAKDKTLVTEYYLIDVIYEPNGYRVTTDPKVADGFSSLVSSASYIDKVHRDALPAAAKAAKEAFWAAENKRAALYK